MQKQSFADLEIAHVSRPIPEELGIVSGSVPITAFGDFDRAQVATLSLNPSYLEFSNQKGTPLSKGKSRLISRHELEVADNQSLDRSAALRVIDSLRTYFAEDANPYRKWFGPMESWVLSSVGASYWKGSATHLDLSQWATNPVWKKLSEASQQSILESDLPFLKKQIETKKFDLVLLNGARVVDEMSKTLLVDLKIDSEVEVGDKNVVFYSGSALGTTFLGWNWYLQSAISNNVREAISSWLSAK